LWSQWNSKESGKAAADVINQKLEEKHVEHVEDVEHVKQIEKNVKQIEKNVEVIEKHVKCKV
jgi:hypothetical protein